MEHNQQLAYKRSIAIREYLELSYPELRDILLNIHSEVYRWSELIFYIKRDNSFPHKKRVIGILEAEGDFSRATIEWRLKNIDNGVVWRHIVKHHLRYLRSGGVAINVYMRRDTISKADTIVKEKQVIALPPEVAEPIITNSYVRKPILAIKTNLLYDALLIPNIKVEVPIGDRFSISGEWIFPWWVGENNDKALQILAGTVDGRYWFGDRIERDKLTGWFGGFYAGGGLYDIQYNSEGYQGEFFIAAGLSGGYAHSINKNGNLRMEYSLGMGYLQTNYRYYKGEENNKYLVWQSNGKYSWIGPTKLEVSLVWMLNFKRKIGGAR